MRLTTKSKYGIRLILDIALHGKEKSVPLSEIAKRQNISFKYLEHLTRKLNKANILNSQRGPFGGHMLTRSPDKITIGDLVRTLEDTSTIPGCTTEDTKKCDICKQTGVCVSKFVWVEASKAMFGRLDKITIGSLLKKINFEVEL